MKWNSIHAFVIVLAVLPGGCGTTRTTDTLRTATEQILISNSIDETIAQMDFRGLAGKPVFFDAIYLDGVTDKGYLISSIRQHLLANGCLLQEDRTKSTYVVEARAGAIGTDRHDLLFGIPQITVPAIMPGYPGGIIPEIAFARKSDKKGVAKVAVFAYNRTTGRPVLQTGIAQAVSTGKDIWVMGAGPFQRGTIHEGTEFAGEQIQIPLLAGKDQDQTDSLQPIVPVTRHAAWEEPKEETAKKDDKTGVVQAGATAAPATPAAKPADKPAAAAPKPVAVSPPPPPLSGPPAMPPMGTGK